MELSESQEEKQTNSQGQPIQNRAEPHVPVESKEMSVAEPKAVTNGPSLQAFKPAEREKKPSEDRLAMLSDGVFAIAVTLLVLNIQLPPNGINENAFKNYLSGSFLSETIFYLITFVVLAFYWMNHRDLMNGLKRVNRPFLLLNLLFLAFVAFFPVASNLLRYTNFPEAVIIYTAILSGCGYLSLLLFFCAYIGKLFYEQSYDVNLIAIFAAAITPTYFLVSLFLLLIPHFDSGNVFYFWLVLPVASFIIRRTSFGKAIEERRRQKHIESQT